MYNRSIQMIYFYVHAEHQLNLALKGHCSVTMMRKSREPNPKKQEKRDATGETITQVVQSHNFLLTPLQPAAVLYPKFSLSLSLSPLDSELAQDRNAGVREGRSEATVEIEEWGGSGGGGYRGNVPLAGL